MTRNRYKKSHVVTLSQPSHSQAPEMSPATQEISQRITSGGVDCLEENFIRVMIGSEQLAEEPEFKDLTMDGDRAMRATQHWMRKFEKRLAAAEKKGSDEHQQVFDDMRIEVIAELATPAFRKDVERRLQALLDRLQTGDDLEKLEMVMMLQAMLGMKRLPWGICCLILAIYQRTMQPILQGSEQEQEIFNAIDEVLKANEGDDVDLLALLEDPKKLDQFAQKIFGAQPDLRQRAEEQIWKMVEDFEGKLGHGDIELNLFSDQEIISPFERMYAEFGKVAFQEQLSNEMKDRFIEIIRQTIADIMTPKRFRRFREDVEKTAKTWLRTNQKWAAALQAELADLEGDLYEDNSLVLAAYFGQLSRLGKKQAAASKNKKHH